jgi:glycosyltransferase involved in cell wall biosynthesis
MTSQRLRVLIVAHELSPIKGSECAVGWNIVTRLAKYHDITVLYSSGSQFRNTSYVDSINSYFDKSSSISGLTLINIDKPGKTRLTAKLNFIFKKLSPIGLPFLYYLGYKYWQKAAYREAKRLHGLNNFDVVHQLTQISFREPGYLWKLDIPFVWGPTGGTSTFPKKFNKLLSAQSKLLEWIRSVSNYYQFRFVPRVLKANRKAAIIYAFSQADADRLQKRATGQIKIMLDVGTYSRQQNETNINKDKSILKGIWCGRLSDYKAPSILLESLAQSQLTREKIKFTIIGLGSLEEPMLGLASDLQLKNIEWIREVKHDEIFGLMGQADFFVHTSLREATSSVITEALTMGLPVICHDAYGMSIAINETCGIKVPFVSPELSIKGFHDAMERLLLDDGLLEKLKIGAYQRSLEISWDVMAEKIAADYLEIGLKNKLENSV